MEMAYTEVSVDWQDQKISGQYQHAKHVVEVGRMGRRQELAFVRHDKDTHRVAQKGSSRGGRWSRRLRNRVLRR